MENPQLSGPVEVIIKEGCDKISIRARKNGNKTLPINGDKLVTWDIGHENILHRLGVNQDLLVALNLSHCNLSYLPSFFNDCYHLQELNLSCNNLTEVPELIFNSLRLLTELDLSYNKISSFDGLPKCAYKLRVLRLNNNFLTNIPEFILRVCCLNLEELYYSNNEIISLSSSKFLHHGPYRLKKVELKNCLLRMEDLKYLKQIRTLKEFNISNEGQINRNCIEFFKCLESLFENTLWDDQLLVLKLNDLHLSDLSPHVSELINLRELHLSKNHIFWLPEAIGQLKHLKFLDVSENNLFMLCNDIANLENLEVLKAAYNHISGLPDLASLNIKLLDLYDNCLNSYPPVNWDAVVMIDLDNNYFDTSENTIVNYEEKLVALRDSLNVTRNNGSKEIIESSYSDEDDVYCGSPEDDNGSSGCVGEYKPEQEQECWSSFCDNFDNGCTVSDNEWTGVEKLHVKQKSVKKRITQPPSWMLVDADE